MAAEPNERAVSSASEVQKQLARRVELFRDLCDRIRRREPMDERFTLVAASMLYEMPNACDLVAMLTDDELQLLRPRMCGDCLAYAAQDLQSKGKPDLDVHQTLVLYDSALQLLGPPAEEDEPYLFSMALLCLALDKYREARGFLQKLLDQNPEDSFAIAALPVVSDCISLPRFRVAYLSRCKMAWATASDMLEDYCKGEIEAQEAEDSVSSAFRILAGLDVLTFLHPPKGGVLEFSLYNWEQSYYPSIRALEVWHNELPAHSRQAWEAHIGDSPLRDVPMEDGSTLDFQEIQTALIEDKERKGVHLKLYHPRLAPHADSPRLRKALIQQVSSNMNGADFCIYILDVEVLSHEPDHCTGTIATLPQQLAALGYPLDRPQLEIETTRMLQTYQRHRREGAISRLRDDILAGATSCMALQSAYEAGQTDAADYYMDRGIAPCFIAWPRFILNCNELTFTEQLVDGLLKAEVPHNAKLIGRAFGTQYCYLDMLLYNTYAVVEHLEKYFSQIPGGDAVRIQSFYPDATPCPVSRAYLLEHSRWAIGGTPVLYDMFPNTSHTGPAKKPNKKKNAAKAKRKHQKKFH